MIHIYPGPGRRMPPDVEHGNEEAMTGRNWREFKHHGASAFRAAPAPGRCADGGI